MVARNFFEEVLDCTRMSPGEELIQVFERGVQIIVAFRTNSHDSEGTKGANLTRERCGFLIRDCFAIADAELS